MNTKGLRCGWTDLDLEHGETVDPCHESGESGLPGTADTYQQQMTLRGEERRGEERREGASVCEES